MSSEYDYESTTAHIIRSIAAGRTFDEAVGKYGLEDTSEWRQLYEATVRDMADMKARGIVVDTL